MLDRITFSIIIPTYNRCLILKDTITSVINQEEKSWELIIVDDGSNDNTREMVLTFNDDRVKYIYQENKERSAARNNGINIAAGDWICFLDSDDEFLPNHLSVLKTFINDHKIDKEAVIRTFCIEKSENETINQPIKELTGHAVNYLFESILYPSTLCFHRGIFNTFRFNEKFSLAEDTELLVKVFSKYPLLLIKRHTVIIKKHVGNTQSFLTGEKHIQYFNNLKQAFEFKDASSLINRASLNNLLSKRILWATNEFKKEKKRFKALRIAFKNFNYLIKDLGFYKVTSHVVKLLF